MEESPGISEEKVRKRQCVNGASKPPRLDPIRASPRPPPRPIPSPKNFLTSRGRNEASATHVMWRFFHRFSPYIHQNLTWKLTGTHPISPAYSIAFP